MAAATSKNVEAESNTQEALAQSLLDCMGRESAIHVCKVNGWIGVLRILTGDQKAPCRTEA